MVARWQNDDRSGLGSVLWVVDLGSRVLAVAIWTYMLVHGVSGEVTGMWVAVVFTTIGAIASIVRTRLEPFVAGAPARRS